MAGSRCRASSPSGGVCARAPRLTCARVRAPPHSCPRSCPSSLVPAFVPLLTCARVRAPPRRWQHDHGARLPHDAGVPGVPRHERRHGLGDRAHQAPQGGAQDQPQPARRVRVLRRGRRRMRQDVDPAAPHPAADRRRARPHQVARIRRQHGRRRRPGEVPGGACCFLCSFCARLPLSLLRCERNPGCPHSCKTSQPSTTARCCRTRSCWAAPTVSVLCTTRATPTRSPTSPA